MLDHAFGHAPGATLSPLLPLGQNFALGKKPQVEIVTAFSSLDSCLHFPISLNVEGGCWCVFDVPFIFYGRITSQNLLVPAGICEWSPLLQNCGSKPPSVGITLYDKLYVWAIVGKKLSLGD